MKKANALSQFVKEHRQKAGYTQETFAKAAGVGLRFIRELEQGKSTLRMDKVNQVLSFFNHRLGPIEGGQMATNLATPSRPAVTGNVLGSLL